jgi:hypothetical protein
MAAAGLAAQNPNDGIAITAGLERKPVEAPGVNGAPRHQQGMNGHRGQHPKRQGHETGSPKTREPVRPPGKPGYDPSSGRVCRCAGFCWRQECGINWRDFSSK